MEKKENLINGLRRAITALKNDTIHYKWTNQESCNCGIVAQAILEKSSEEIKKDFSPVLNKLVSLNEGKEEKDKLSRTWKNGVKYLCPITGESMYGIFNDLMAAGMSKSDIVHLEYMDNPAILAKSNIETVKPQPHTHQSLKETKEVMVTIPHPNWFKRLVGMTKDELREEKVYETIEDIKKVPIDYWSYKDNLIKYLQAWVGILEEGTQHTESDLEGLSVEDLESELLNVLAEENYERAGEIKATLATM